MRGWFLCVALAYINNFLLIFVFLDLKPGLYDSIPFSFKCLGDSNRTSKRLRISEVGALQTGLQFHSPFTYLTVPSFAKYISKQTKTKQLNITLKRMARHIFHQKSTSCEYIIIHCFISLIALKFS